MPLFFLILFVLFCVMLSANDVGRYPATEFLENETKYRLAMSENYNRNGGYKWASIPNNSMMAIASNSFVFVIEEKPETLNELIKKRHSTRNLQPTNKGAKSQFEVPFHFDCHYDPKQIGSALFLVIQTC
jgi:hypothetical protein